MKRNTATKLLALTLCANIGLVSPQVALAEDIDIFLGTSGGDTVNPRILIVLDNTSNWSRQSQQWPGGKTQGESEVAAISSVINQFKFNATDPDIKKVSAGLMEFVTDGNANDNGGFIRSAIRDLTPANVNAFDAHLKTIGSNINSPTEKRNSNTPYGNLMFDIYNYFAGANSYSGHATNASRADTGGYTTPFSRFKSPLTADNTCGRSFVVFISNPNSSGPAADDADNSARLKAANGGTLPPQIKLPNFVSTSVSTPGTVGTTAACHASATAAATELTSFATVCSTFTDGCKIGVPTANDGATACAPNTSKYSVIGTDTIITNVPTTTTTTDSKPYNADEWVRLMHDKGILVPGTTATRSKVTTYTIDVHNKQPSAEHTSLLLSMAKAGGGRYFKATSEKAIADALREIMIEIQAVNSSFASTSLPVNATNRSQNLNQVFIGMFRPDPASRPRWWGNLKRYQLVRSGTGSDIKLADVNGNDATNPLTGFVTPCAVSYWTRDSGAYWQNKGVNPDPAGGCELAGISPYSDVADGPFVEKGGAAQAIREGNVGAPNAVTQAVNRKMLTLTPTGFAELTAANSGLDANLVKWIRGEDVYDEKGTNEKTLTRPTIHGDVIHSRPQPVNYGGDTANPVISVYYGANDGTLRSVDARTGVERWSFVPPEFFSRLTRIRDNTTRIHFPGIASGFSPTPTRKDYFYDGSTGVYQNADSSSVWIFPSMRRGGRMLYGIDVSDPATPVFKWRAGCPNLNNDTGCTEGMSGIGQTWSTPNVAFLRGYSATTPVVVVGGGYDKCEDADTKAPACTSTKGGFVYILDANTGARIRAFETERAVAADIALVDITNDGSPDYAYAADTGGNLYRIDFITNLSTKLPRASGDWIHRKVAHTATDSGRKFLFAPTLVYSQNMVYLAIGSGDREHPLRGDYPYEDVLNRFYVYRDSLAAGAGTAAQNLDSMADYSNADRCDTPPILPGSGLAGWYMDLNENGQGEQVVTSALIAAGMVTFSTNRPIPQREGSCSTILGEARGYWVNLLNASGAIGVQGACGGRRSSTFVGGGMPATPVFASSVSLGKGGVQDQQAVVIGAVLKDSDNSGGASTPTSPSPVTQNVSLKRKRAYTATKGQ